MAVSASFHQNVFLLNQLIPPNNDFKKLFREGMFDKPNIAGFVQVSHYLLMICDAERFKKLVEWPVTCKKTEAKYRNDVRDYLNIIALENPDIGFPRILSTYLHHASGTKFTIIMWKLSQLALRRYIIHNDDHEIISIPKEGSIYDLAKTYLEQSKTNVARNISSRHRNCLQMEKAANFALAKEKEELAKIKASLFDRKQSMTKCADVAPVDSSIKQRLLNVEDSEIIKMWKSSLDKNVCYIRRQHTILRDMEKICENINGIVSNMSSDAELLDVNQMEEINCSSISELPLPPDIQHCLYHLYNDKKLVYNNFIRLFASILCQIYICLRKGELMDLSQCLLQIEASIEDVKSVYNVFKTFLTSMINSTEETQNVLFERNVEYMSGENALPHVKNVLLMPSPVIKINPNCADKNDLNKLLQFTPGEITHKSLFSRYMRCKPNNVPNLKTNLFVSRINVDNTIPLGNNEKLPSSMRFITPKINRLCKKTTGKYSRLFSMRTNKNMKANCSMMSLPSSGQANSSAIANTIGEMHNLSDFNLDTTARGLFNSSQEFLTSVQFSPINRDISRDTSAKVKDMFNCELNINKPELNEITEVQFVSNEDNKNVVVKQENVTRRRSISDLVERYKKLLEVSNCTAAKFEDKCTEYENE